MTTVPSRGLIGFIKKSWSTNPEIVGSAFMGLIGVGLCAFSAYYYYSNDLDNRRHKLTYTVIRDDDPKAARVRKD